MAVYCIISLQFGRVIIYVYHSAPKHTYPRLKKATTTTTKIPRKIHTQIIETEEMQSSHNFYWRKKFTIFTRIHPDSLFCVTAVLRVIIYGCYSIRSIRASGNPYIGYWYLLGAIYMEHGRHCCAMVLVYTTLMGLPLLPGYTYHPIREWGSVKKIGLWSCLHGTT